MTGPAQRATPSGHTSGGHTSGGHTPVLLPEVLDALEPRDGGIYVDGTFGAGGYTTALLEAADCRVWAIDRDPEAIRRGGAAAERFAGRLRLVEGRFGDMDRLLEADGVQQVQGVALDVGLSSNQLDDPARGFSFRFDGALDMRMAGAAAGERSAADLVNALPEDELAQIIRDYGEERRSRQVARAIVKARTTAPLTRSGQLAQIVRRVVRPSRDGIDPATRTFQALRIFVNDELGELERGLRAAERLLEAGGRLAVVSFHSLEDRRVKAFLQARSDTGPGVSRHAPLPTAARPAPSFKLLFKGTRKPGPVECRANPRARSARLRAAERTAATAFAEANRGEAR